MSIEAMKRIKSLLQDTKMIDSHTISAVVAECDMVILTQQPDTGEPVAWIRRHPNGALSNELLTHVQVEQVRRDSGAWVPLYTHPAPSVPATGEPVAWNSIQIASWIGSQLMHEPSMFERATVCKFVRSLGRHPTLLKHSR